MISWKKKANVGGLIAALFATSIAVAATGRGAVQVPTIQPAQKFEDRGPFAIQFRHVGYKTLDEIKVSSRFQSKMLEFTKLSLPPTGGFIQENQKKYMQSFLQKSGNTVGAYISTQDLQERGLYTEIRGGGPHLAYANEYTNVEVYPFRNNEGFTLEADVAVPAIEQITRDGQVYPGGGLPSNLAPLAQVSFIVYLRDMTRPDVVFAFVVLMYDSFHIPNEWIGNDTYTYFMSTNVKGSRYVTPLVSSAAPTTIPFAERRHFGFGITRANIRNVIADLKSKLNLSENPDDYRLTIAGVLVESPNYVAGAHTNFGMNISNLSLTTDVPASILEPTASFYLDGVVNASKTITAGQGANLRYESTNANSCTLAAFINGNLWYENKDFKTSHDWGFVKFNNPAAYRWDIVCKNNANGKTARSSVSLTVNPVEATSARFYLDGVVDASKTIRRGQGVNLRYESTSASSCTLSAYINGSLWYENVDFKTSHDWGFVTFNSPAAYRWEIVCKNNASGQTARSFAALNVQ